MISSPNSAIRESQQSELSNSCGKVVVGVVLTAMVFSLTSCKETVPKEEYDKIQKELMQIEDVKSKQERQFNETLEIMNQIEENLSKIDKAKQDLLGSKNSRDRIMNHVRNIDSLIKSNYAMISTLNSRIQESRLNIQTLKDQVSNYEVAMKGKESEIEKMKGQITILNQEKVDLQKNIAYKEETIKQNEVVINGIKAEVNKRDSILQLTERNYKRNQAEALLQSGEKDEKLGDKISGLFSPQKKKDYYKSALKNYEDAIALGSDEAREKAERLRTKTK